MLMPPYWFYVHITSYDLVFVLWLAFGNVRSLVLIIRTRENGRCSLITPCNFTTCMHYVPINGVCCLCTNCNVMEYSAGLVCKMVITLLHYIKYIVRLFF